MSEPLRILYENHRGETRERTLAAPIMIFRESRWHEGSQWLISALDTESNAMRDFAVSGIRSQAQAARIVELERTLAAERATVGLCLECSGTGDGEPATLENPPEPCHVCGGVGSKAYDRGREYAFGYISAISLCPEGVDLWDHITDLLRAAAKGKP